MSQKAQVIAAVYGKENNAGRVVGQSLKSLREAVGYTQLQMAEKLGIGQAAISKIEARGDVQLSSLKKYVESLGASLRIEAAFSADSDVSARLREELHLEDHSDRQLILPIFNSDELISEATKDLIISIHPRYSEKILEGKKTVELRRRFPVSTARGTKIYIYKSAFIKKQDFEMYFEGLSEGFALELTNVQTFENPMNLKELKERFNFTPPQSFIYAKQEMRRALMDEQTNISN
ncbi:hypothetical protein AO284_27300 [Pseudomonas sp. NZIPFR-PS2]|nr:hypothetical protein AO284_27300 [Pseudomonas sp. NZIPFR-PS2]